jgi:hypothetical protein
MATINSLLAHLDERTIAQQVGIRHDEARIQYHIPSNTITNFDQFRDIITDYCIYHHARCISNGGALAHRDAYGKAKELLENAYRRKHGDIVSAYNDAHDGTNGGVRVVLDTIAEGLKAEAVERYITDAFDRHVAPNSWEQRVDMIRQFISQFSNVLSSSIVASQPERYARDWNELIRSYAEGIRPTLAMYRRL